MKKKEISAVSTTFPQPGENDSLPPPRPDPAFRARPFWVPAIKTKGRPRFVNGMVFTDKATSNFEELVGWCAKQAGLKELAGPVELTVRIVIPFHRDFNKTRRELLNDTYAYEDNRDLSNFVKAIEDGMNKVAYFDDHQICRIIATKVWGPEAGCWVTVAPLGGLTK